MVSVQNFLNAFSQQWRADWKNKRKATEHAYQKRKVDRLYAGKNRKDFSDTFFDRLAKKISQKALRERQNLDVVYYTKTARNAPQDKDMIRPACLNVIIEDENNEDVEKGMWKLLMWRAPLKVLIFYD